MALKALKKRLTVALTALEQGDTLRAQENVAFAVGMVDELIRQEKLPVAAQLGRLGGTVTAKRGPEYFRELAAKRKTHGGGRPRKDSE